MGVLLKCLRWLLGKFGAAALIALVGLLLWGGWLFLRDQWHGEKDRAALLTELRAQREQLRLHVSVAEERWRALQTALAEKQRRLEQTERLLGNLRDLYGWWERLFQSEKERREEEERLRRLEELRGQTRGRLLALEKQLTEAAWERDRVGKTLQETERRLVNAEEERSRFLAYARRAWGDLRSPLAWALLAFFFGPTLWALIAFYLLAPLAARSPPLRLRSTPQPPLDVGESRVSVEVAVAPGEAIWIKEKFLQASDEALQRRTRFVFDWRIPLTSAACGLIELVEMRNDRSSSALQATISNADDAHVELTVLSLPEEGSVVLRPSSLAGVAKRHGERLVIRRHWRLFSLQSWITLQFRYFEFCGPCRLVLAGARGVRAERLEAPEGDRVPRRRTNQDAVIGFTPILAYRPVRAETFWAYYRGMNPLFDDLFEGEGTFLCQEIAVAHGVAAKARRFWQGFWNGLLKLLGL